MSNETNYVKKFILMALTGVVLMIGLLIIGAMVFSRKNQSGQVSDSIAQQWGYRVDIDGPYIATADSLGCDFYPDSLLCDVIVESKTLHRGIYEAEVFVAEVNISGTFDFSNFKTNNKTVDIIIELPDLQLTEIDELQLGNKPYKLQPQPVSKVIATVNSSELHGNKHFSTNFKLNGSEKIRIFQGGNISEITISGNAENPSFIGTSLPSHRTVENGKFSAQWVTKNFIGEDFRNYCDVNFLVGVDRYQKVSRSIKYSLLIILLTFAAVLFVEYYTRRQIPLFNYFLIGAALILFYSLLLSLCEIVGFGFAYLIASVMTVAMITTYMWKMLGSSKIGMIIGGLLSLLYSACYVMLCAETYALLIGNSILFVSLAAFMVGSIKISHEKSF